MAPRAGFVLPTPDRLGVLGLVEALGEFVVPHVLLDQPLHLVTVAVLELLQRGLLRPRPGDHLHHLPPLRDGQCDLLPVHRGPPRSWTRAWTEQYTEPRSTRDVPDGVPR